MIAYRFRGELRCPVCTWGWASDHLRFRTHRPASCERILNMVADQRRLDRAEVTEDEFPVPIGAEIGREIMSYGWPHCADCGKCLDHDLGDCEPVPEGSMCLVCGFEPTTRHPEEAALEHLRFDSGHEAAWASEETLAISREGS